MRGPARRRIADAARALSQLPQCRSRNPTSRALSDLCQVLWGFRLHELIFKFGPQITAGHDLPIPANQFSSLYPGDTPHAGQWSAARTKLEPRTSGWWVMTLSDGPSRETKLQGAPSRPAQWKGGDWAGCKIRRCLVSSVLRRNLLFKSKTGRI